MDYLDCDCGGEEAHLLSGTFRLIALRLGVWGIRSGDKERMCDSLYEY